MTTNRKGFALSIVLWIVAALLLGIAFVISLSKDTLSITQSLKNKMEATIKAEDFLEILKYAVPTANYDSRSLIISSDGLPVKLPSPIILDGRKYTIGSITFSLHDTSAMFRIRYPSSSLLARFFSTDQQRELRFTLKDALLDWTDEDATVRLNGAESAYYRIKKGVAFMPRNTPALQSVYELRIIKGYDRIAPKRWKALSRYLYDGRGSAYDLVLMDASQLAALLDIDISEAKQYQSNIQQNKIHQFYNAISKLHTFDDEVMGLAISHNTYITIDVQIGMAHSHIETLIDFKGNTKQSYVTQSFKRY